MREAKSAVSQNINRESCDIDAEMNNLYAVFLWIFVNNILVETFQLIDFMI